jgi:hypothetical protein
LIVIKRTKWGGVELKEIIGGSWTGRIWRNNLPFIGREDKFFSFSASSISATFAMESTRTWGRERERSGEVRKRMVEREARQVIFITREGVIIHAVNERVSVIAHAYSEERERESLSMSARLH